jgi:hypothetical protein
MNRKLRNLLMPSVLAALAMGGIGGCVVRETAAPTVAVAPTPPPDAPPDAPADAPAPPPPIVEVQPPMPAPGYLWIGGYYGWGGGRYFWHGGYWGHAPYGYHRWYGGYWRAGPRGRFFVRGHWG